MTEAVAPYSILLIDDKQEVLDSLSAHLAGLLSPADVKVRTWCPNKDEQDPDVEFASRVDDSTVLVATDYDLTGKGMKGLFGLTIVGWCQQRSIPVGDFSRGHVDLLPKEPNLFELRVPPTDAEAARFISSAFKGFRHIRGAIAGDAELLPSKRSLPAILAIILQRPHLDDQLALYMSRLGSANSSLVQRLRDFATGTPDDDDKVQVLTYVLGHVLLNAVLKFPGPILSEDALQAYLATSSEEAEVLQERFAAAGYAGPFSESARYYWREDVDTILDGLSAPIAQQNFDGVGDFNRAVLEASLGRKLAPHQCGRDCGGLKGGFLCPFTNRPVCERGDCSVSSSSWIPQGAQLSRVERDYYDEWAPLLGL